MPDDKIRKMAQCINTECFAGMEFDRKMVAKWEAILREELEPLLKAAEAVVSHGYEENMVELAEVLKEWGR